MNKIPLLSTGMVQNTLNDGTLTAREKAEKIANDVNDYRARYTNGPYKRESADFLERLIIEYEIERSR